MIRECSCLPLLMSACLVFIGLHNIQADDEVENLVQNASFEDFGMTIWVEDNSAMATMTIDKRESFTGDQSLLIDISKKGSGQRVELHQNPFTLKNGQKLTYAFWAKTEEDDVRLAKMIVNHREDPWTSYAYKEITITDEWTEFWVPVVMTADDNIVGIYIELRDSPGLIWFDHFRLYEGDYMEEDLEAMPKIAVKPHSKLASTWAAVKAAH